MEELRKDFLKYFRGITDKPIYKQVNKKLVKVYFSSTFTG